MWGYDFGIFKTFILIWVLCYSYSTYLIGRVVSGSSCVCCDLWFTEHNDFCLILSSKFVALNYFTCFLQLFVFRSCSRPVCNGTKSINFVYLNAWCYLFGLNILDSTFIYSALGFNCTFLCFIFHVLDITCWTEYFASFPDSDSHVNWAGISHPCYISSQ